jgi:hypothetical protein
MIEVPNEWRARCSYHRTRPTILEAIQVIDTSVLLDAALEHHRAHAAVCRNAYHGAPSPRPRAQGLACSTCAALLDALIRALKLALGEVL